MHYNVAAKKLARRLQALGASACVALGLGDDQHPHGFEAALDPWLAALWPALRARAPLPLGTSEVCISTPGMSAPPESPQIAHPCKARRPPPARLCFTCLRGSLMHGLVHKFAAPLGGSVPCDKIDQRLIVTAE